MEEEFDMIEAAISLMENITNKYFVCKQTCDKYQAKTKMEEKRLKGIKVMPGAEKKSVEAIEFKTRYTPYFYLKGNYSITYLRRNKYTLQVDSNVLAIKIHDSIIDMAKMVRVKPNELELDVSEKLSYESDGEITLDKDLNEIQKKTVPYYDEIDENTYNEYLSNNEIIESRYTPNYFIEKLKEKIIKKRPIDAIKSLDETFKADVNIILRAQYEGIFEFKGQIIKMIVDSVTGRDKIVKKS